MKNEIYNVLSHSFPILMFTWPLWIATQLSSHSKVA